MKRTMLFAVAGLVSCVAPQIAFAADVTQELKQSGYNYAAVYSYIDGIESIIENKINNDKSIRHQIVKLRSSTEALQV